MEKAQIIRRGRFLSTEAELEEEQEESDEEGMVEEGNLQTMLTWFTSHVDGKLSQQQCLSLLFNISRHISRTTMTVKF